MQANWIGRSEGGSIRFPIAGRETPLEVFTTRPDTLMGATFMVVAAEHPLVAALAAEGKLLAEAGRFVERLKRARVENRFAVETEKEGVALGVEAVHPITGARMPVWVANYVLMGYGTGAIMAVPAHDQRDFEFATAYHLPIVEVIRPADGPRFDGKAAYEGDGVLVHSSPFDGLPAEEGKRAVVARTTIQLKVLAVIFFDVGFLHPTCRCDQKSSVVNDLKTKKVRFPTERRPDVALWRPPGERGIDVGFGFNGEYGGRQKRQQGYDQEEYFHIMMKDA